MPDKKLIQKVAERTMRWNFRMWGFGEAIALRGLIRASEVTGNCEMLGYVHALLRAYVGRGVAKSAEEHVAPGRELLLLHKKFGDAKSREGVSPAHITHQRKPMGTIRLASLDAGGRDAHPTLPASSFLYAAKRLAALHGSFSKNSKGARIHRCDLPGWREQIWVDCMDSEAPFLAQLGAVTGEKKYFNQASDELLSYAQLLQDSASGLFFHGYETHCGLNGQLWARGNGWALVGLVETLQHLPKYHSSRKELLRRLHQLCAGLAKTQDRSGLWHTVIPNAETYLESTLATMTAFALREAFSGKFLSEKEFGAMEKRARSAALRCIDNEGGLQLVSDATPIGELKMYASRPFGIFPWGQGPLLLMLTQN